MSSILGIFSYFPVDPVIATIWLVAGGHRARSAAMRLRAIRPLLFLACLETVAATGSDDRMKCPIFDGTSMTWTAWYIGFTGWIAWKESKLVSFLAHGVTGRPKPVDPKSPTDAEKKLIIEWEDLNIRLYGALLMHLSDPLKVSLHTVAPTDGCSATLTSYPRGLT